VPGLTLLGDAAHLTMPSGEGADPALFDGAELGEAIAAHPGDIEAALAAYEATLFPRSAEAVAHACRLLPMYLNDDAPHSLVEMFNDAFQSRGWPPRAAGPPWTARAGQSYTRTRLFELD
jgi:2-polyprenyl-6-methoxyphenol hydroxylase-like FAD-dependent oxidoreductase